MEFDVVTVLMCLLPFSQGFSIWTTRIIEPPMLDLVDMVKQVESFRYTDSQKMLTAIKDKKLQSCFVTDYDPFWQLYMDEKESIIASKNFEKYDTEDFPRLQKKAGEVIANMCLLARIYWLNNLPLPPKLDPVLAQGPMALSSQNIGAPPKLGNAPAPFPDSANRMPAIDSQPMIPDSSNGAMLEPSEINSKPGGDMIAPPKMQAPPRIVQEGEELVEPPRINNFNSNNFGNGDLKAPPTIRAPERNNLALIPDVVAPPRREERARNESPRYNMARDVSQNSEKVDEYLVPPPPDMSAPKMPVH